MTYYQKVSNAILNQYISYFYRLDKDNFHIMKTTDFYKFISLNVTSFVVLITKLTNSNDQRNCCLEEQVSNIRY